MPSGFTNFAGRQFLTGIGTDDETIWLFQIFSGI